MVSIKNKIIFSFICCVLYIVCSLVPFFMNNLNINENNKNYVSNSY
ncbi:hypothetical protein BHWA1_02362 [Brachyspira hyodysenteriae WA1]|uniref:Uncharacterized protein n=1 Tax=Brachyspira hyodysenteriae (strain ATCC 49526 / WA1) TaxID=565034 RepID=A0A3B6VLP3_BRAHW|nr:hypothetical protein BHWA1_02362 [Brachyspira hyodysenteriae WA1]AUJ50541.1 hypothetical protein BH718_02111 [Brachyspira hyodysenteriae]